MIRRALFAAVVACISFAACAGENEPAVWEAGVGGNSCWSMLRIPSIEDEDTSIVISAYFARLHRTASILLSNYPGLSQDDLIFEVSFFSLGELNLSKLRIDGTNDSWQLRQKQIADADKGRATYFLGGKEADSVRLALEQGAPPSLSVTVGGVRAEKRSLRGERVQVSLAMFDACAKTMSPNQPLHPTTSGGLTAAVVAGERRR